MLKTAHLNTCPTKFLFSSDPPVETPVPHWPQEWAARTARASVTDVVTRMVCWRRHNGTDVPFIGEPGGAGKQGYSRLVIFLC